MSEMQSGGSYAGRCLHCTVETRHRDGLADLVAILNQRLLCRFGGRECGVESEEKANEQRKTVQHLGLRGVCTTQIMNKNARCSQKFKVWFLGVWMSVRCRGVQIQSVSKGGLGEIVSSRSTSPRSHSVPHLQAGAKIVSTKARRCFIVQMVISTR